MFAEAAGWNRPIRFARGAGAPLDVLSAADQARRHRVRRLVFAHIIVAGADNAVRPGRAQFDHHEGILPWTLPAPLDHHRWLGEDAWPCYCDWRTSA
jgi:hypothetical protein